MNLLKEVLIIPVLFVVNLGYWIKDRL